MPPKKVAECTKYLVKSGFSVSGKFKSVPKSKRRSSKRNSRKRRSSKRRSSRRKACPEGSRRSRETGRCKKKSKSRKSKSPKKSKSRKSKSPKKSLKKKGNKCDSDEDIYSPSCLNKQKVSELNKLIDSFVDAGEIPESEADYTKSKADMIKLIQKYT